MEGCLICDLPTAVIKAILADLRHALFGRCGRGSHRYPQDAAVGREFSANHKQRYRGNCLVLQLSAPAPNRQFGSVWVYSNRIVHKRNGIAQALRLLAGRWLSSGQPDMLGVFACGKCDPHCLGGVSGREFR